MSSTRPEQSVHGLIPRLVTTLDGRRVTVVPGEDFTITDRDGRKYTVPLAFLSASSVASPVLGLVTDLLSTHSVAYAYNCARALKVWLEAVGERAGDVQLHWLTPLADTKTSGLASYRPFVLAVLHRWARSSRPGLSGEVRDFLNDAERWEERDSGAYFTLLTNDPERGALTNQELRNLHDALDKAHIDGMIPFEDYVLAWFFIATGVRPVQVHRMTVGDVQIQRGPEGDEVNLLVQLAKGENSVAIEKWRRRAPTVLANCLCRFMRLPEIASRSPSARLFSFGSPAHVGRHLKNIFTKLETWSARLEGPIPMFPYRFRYTLGTRALADGATDHEVARLLTHRTTHCIQYYRASMPELQRPIRDRLGETIGRIAKAFTGRLIRDLSEASRADDDDALIRDFLRLDGSTVGACGTRIECLLHAPIACLTCPFFEPFLDAPWERLRDQIEADGVDEAEPRIREIHSHSLEALAEIMANRDAILAESSP